MKPVVSSSMRPMSPAFSHCSYVRISHASSHTPPFAPSFNSGTKTESSHFRKCCFFTGSWQVGSMQEMPCAIISAALPPPPPAWQIGIIELHVAAEFETTGGLVSVTARVVHCSMGHGVWDDVALLGFNTFCECNDLVLFAQCSACPHLQHRSIGQSGCLLYLVLGGTHLQKRKCII